MRYLIFGLVLVAGSGWARAEESVQGEYLEARNADIWTGPCFANGEFNIVGNRATLAWKVTEGRFDGVELTGRSIVAVVFGNKTFGLSDDVKTRTVMVVDAEATAPQREALIAMAKKLTQGLIQEVVAIESAPVVLETGLCDKLGCARLDAGMVKIATRCMGEKDSICGHEDLYYPILARVEHPYPAFAVEHKYTGGHFGETYAHGNARSAVIAHFEAKSESALAAR